MEVRLLVKMKEGMEKKTMSVRRKERGEAKDLES